MEWDKLESETPQAFAAFCVYRDLGSARSLDKAYRQHSGRPDAVATGGWASWSRAHAWTKRAAAYDAHLQQRKLELVQEELQHVAVRRGETAVGFQGLVERAMAIAEKALQRIEGAEAVDIDELARITRTLAALARIAGPDLAGTAETPPTLRREYVGVDVDQV